MMVAVGQLSVWAQFCNDVSFLTSTHTVGPSDLIAYGLFLIKVSDLCGGDKHPCWWNVNAKYLEHVVTNRHYQNPEMMG